MLDREQIVWIKLDCSHSGSERGLCLNFLQEVDRLTGTSYFAAYEKRATVDTLLTEMTRVASVYSLGILFVDEIQHLANSRRDSQKLLNFFVTLENQIGVPVVLMGTPGALPLLQGDFRSARRCCVLIVTFSEVCFSSVVFRGIVKVLEAHSSLYLRYNDVYTSL